LMALPAVYPDEVSTTRLVPTVVEEALAPPAAVLKLRDEPPPMVMAPVVKVRVSLAPNRILLPVLALVVRLATVWVAGVPTVPPESCSVPPPRVREEDAERMFDVTVPKPRVRLPALMVVAPV